MSTDFHVNLNEYEITETIGQGPYGDVYLIEHKSTKEKYIAKTLNQELTEKTSQKTFSEILTKTSKIRSQSIASVIGFSLTNFNNENYPTIITEYFPNKPLKVLLDEESVRRGSPNLTGHRKYISILGIALGMQFLHLRGLTNRDLKPSNVLFDDENRPKICDFYMYRILSKTLKNFSEKIECVSLYTAPEVLFNDKYNNKVDVFSFAFVAYEIIVGRPIVALQDGENIDDYLKIIDDGKRPDLSIIAAPAVKECLEKCWLKDPNKRPTFDQVVQMIGNSNFYTPFDINKKEIVDYLALFPDDVKGKKFILSQLDNDILEDEKREKKMQKKKNPIRMFVILIIIYTIVTFISQNIHKYF